MSDALRGLWTDPRPAQPPVRVWRDWMLLGVLVAWSVLETVLRQHLAWRPIVLTVGVVIALTLLWRRTHPLGAVAVAFGTLIVFDVARILTIDATGLLSIAALLVLPYALFRWGSGREAADRPALPLVSGQGRKTLVAGPFALVSSAMHGAARPQTRKAADRPSLPSYRHEEGLGEKLRAQGSGRPLP